MARPVNAYESVSIQITLTPQMEKLFKLRGLLRGNTAGQEILALAMEELKTLRFNIDDQTIRTVKDMTVEEVEKAASYADNLLKERAERASMGRMP